MHGSGEARDMSLNTGPYKEMIRATVQLETSKFPNSETYFNYWDISDKCISYGNVANK